jgi:anaerobic selenocysteine-containing dehydrogenase
MSDRAEPAMLRGGAFTTPSGRIELYSETMQGHCGQGVPTFQPLPDQRAFILVTPASEQRVNSTFGGIASQQSDLRCEIHPADAKARGVEDGRNVTLYNERGAITLPAAISDAVRPGTLFVPKGAWLASVRGDGTANALIPGHQEAAIGGACYYDCSVDLRPA